VLNFLRARRNLGVRKLRCRGQKICQIRFAFVRGPTGVARVARKMPTIIFVYFVLLSVETVPKKQDSPRE
jgi:hypothetical protein